MKHISKRILAIVMCVALLVGVPVSLTASASAQEDAAKQELITAWGNLAGEEIVTLGYSDGAQEIANLPSEVKSQLSAEELAAFGTHFVPLTGTEDKNAASTVPYKGKTISNDFTEISVSVYSTGSIAPYFIAWCNTVSNETGVNSYPAGADGYKKYDYTSNMKTHFAEHTLYGFKYGINWNDSNGGTIYIGSFVGRKTVTAEVPANADTLTAEELYALADAVDLSAYTTGVTEFETALANLNAILNPSEDNVKQALINAWGNMTGKEVVTLGYSGGSQPIEELPENVKSVFEAAGKLNSLGDRFVTLAPGTTYNAVNTTPYFGKTLEEFDEISVTWYATSQSQLEIAVWAADGSLVMDKYPWPTTTVAETSYATPLEPLDAKGMGGVKYAHCSGSGTMYIGSIVGYRAITSEAPENAATLTAKELYAAASAFDLTFYTTGVEAFRDALADLYEFAYPEEVGTKAALIAAWEALAADTKTVTETVSMPPATQTAGNYGSITRYEVDETTDLGVDNALLGTHYSVWTLNGEQTPNWGYTPSFTAPATPVNKPADVAWESMYFYGKALKADGTSANAKFYLQYKGEAAKESIGATWTKIDINLNGSQSTRKFLIQSGSVATAYIGSIMGTYTVNGPAVPANADSMTLAELIEAAKAVDTEGFATEAAFQEAIFAIEKPEELALINAWKALKGEQIVTLGYSGGSQPIEELPENVKSVFEAAGKLNSLGDRFVTLAPGTTYNAVNTTPYFGKTLEEFDEISVTWYATSQSQLEIAVWAADGSLVMDKYPWPTTTVAETSYATPLEPLDAKGMGGVKYAHCSGSGTIYVGSIVGYKTVKAELPANVYSMNIEQLLAAAKALNLTQYTEGVAAFETAKEAVEEKAASIDLEDKAFNELVAAWEAISTQTKPAKKVIAIPQDATVQAVTETTVVEGLDDIAKLGSHYTAKRDVTPGWNLITFNFLEPGINLSQLEKVSFYVIGYGADGAVVKTVPYPQVRTSEGWANSTENLNGTGWMEVPFKRPDTAANGLGFYILNQNGGENVRSIAYGSVVAEYQYTPAMPENYATMSLSDLVLAAKKVDCEGLAGADAFKSALAKAEAYADMAPILRETLMKEWGAMVNYYTEEVATVRDAYTTTTGGTHNTNAVTASTVVEGLSDTSVLGSRYVDRLPLTVAGWTNQYHLVTHENTKKLSKYDKVEMYFAVRNPEDAFTSGKVCLQVNGSEPIQSAEGTGWTKITIGKSDAIISNIKVMLINCANPGSVSFGSVIGTYSERVAMPENVNELDFIELVKAAKAADTTGFDDTAFKAAIQACEDLIAARRKAVMDAWEESGVAIPAGVDDLSEFELAKLALEQDLSAAPNAKEYGRAVWMLNLFGNDGQIMDALRVAFKNVAPLPEKDRLQSLQEWVTAADAVDLSEATPSQITAFETALEAARDLLSKGQSDITELKKLTDDANTMKQYDFTDASWPAFGAARTKAQALLDDYANVTQKQVDAAAAELLAAWGELRMYVRSQWFDFMEYFLQEDPDLSLSSGSGATSTAVFAKEFPNGANAMYQVMGQPQGWNVQLALRGADLANVKEYEFFEVWFVVDPAQGGQDKITVQLVDQLYKKSYNGNIIIPESMQDGQMHRLEIPVSKFINEVANEPLSTDAEFKAFTVKFLNISGSGNYSLANMVIAKTEAVTAGVVPNVPKMEILVRPPVPKPEPPENPFTGVDRGDPWGHEEKEANKKPVADEEIKEEEKGLVAAGTCGENVSWKLTELGELIISGTGDMKDYIDATPWDEYLDQIVTVTVNKGVTSIGNSSFYGCKKLLQVKISDTVTRVGEYSFYDCPLLAFVELPDSVKEIGDYAFGYVYDAKADTAVAVKDFGIYGTAGSVAEDYAAVYELAFFATKPDPNASDDETFEDENEYEGGDDWGTIEPEEDETDTPVDDNEETDVTEVESGSCGASLTWTYYSDGSLVISGTGAMDDFAETAPWVSAGYDVLAVTIEEGVTSIGDSAFYGCRNLASLSVPASVTRVGAFAFYECHSIKELKVSAAVTEVGAYAFGYVYDSTIGNAAVLDGFKLLVVDPSAALDYAKVYEVPYEVYEAGTANEPGTEDLSDPSNGLAWWIWLLIGLGGMIVLAGGAFGVIAIVKSKKNTANTEVSE